MRPEINANGPTIKIANQQITNQYMTRLETQI